MKRFLLILSIVLILYSPTVFCTETEENNINIKDFVEDSTETFTYKYPKDWAAKASDTACVLSLNGESENFAVDWRYPYIMFTLGEIDKSNAEEKRDYLYTFIKGSYDPEAETLEEEFDGIKYYGLQFKMQEADKNKSYSLLTKAYYFDDGEKQGYFEGNFPETINDKECTFSISKGEFEGILDLVMENLKLK